MPHKIYSPTVSDVRNKKKNKNENKHTKRLSYLWLCASGTCSTITNTSQGFIIKELHQQ